MLSPNFESDPYNRGAAAKALGQIGDRTAVPPLSEALKDEAAGVRGSAVQALGLIGDPECLTMLIGISTDSNPWVRSALAKSLCRFDTDDTLPVLEQLRKDFNEKVRGATLFSMLTCHSPEHHVDGFRETLEKDTDAINRTNAIRGLGLVGSADDVPRLLSSLYDSDAGARGEAARALVRMLPKIDSRLQIDIADRLIGYWVACRHTHTFHALTQAIAEMPTERTLRAMYYTGANLKSLPVWKQEHWRRLQDVLRMTSRCRHETQLMKEQMRALATRVWKAEPVRTVEEIAKDVHTFIKREQTSLWSKLHQNNKANRGRNRKEALMQDVMETFWKGLGRGDVHKEIRAGTGRVDIWCYYGVVPVIFELKMLEDIRNDYERGLMQLREYLRQNFVRYGGLILFAENESLYNKLCQNLDGYVTRISGKQHIVCVGILRAWKSPAPSSLA